MNDPWNVKSVRNSAQYESFLRINGVPVLPPVLSKDCRKEMQYYKSLAKEVEVRLAMLKLFQRSKNEQNNNETETETNTKQKSSYDDTGSQPEVYWDSEINPVENVNTYKQDDLGNNEKKIQDLINDKPERDYNCPKITPTMHKENTLNGQDVVMEEFLKVGTDQQAVTNRDIKKPSNNNSLCIVLTKSKSFTGPLTSFQNDSKQTQTQKIIRQNSYTVLTPCPQLVAHLEIESIAKGIDVDSICMSDSTTNLNSAIQKRRNWDLQTAKKKWSSMALELKQFRVNAKKKVKDKRGNNNVVTVFRNAQKSPQKTERATNRLRSPIYSNVNVLLSKYTSLLGTEDKKNTVQSSLTNIESATLHKPTISHILINGENTQVDVTTDIEPSTENPAIKVKELYEKLQRQQLSQMSSLIEKQAQEKKLLEKLFEEQNLVFVNQLKTICPKSPIEIKQAWTNDESSSVSLKQIINESPKETPTTPILPSSQTSTKNSLSRCDDSSKKRNERSIKKPHFKNQKNMSVNSSLAKKNTSRKLNYDNSSEKEVEPILTDRTNDTMADLNVTFPTDSDDSHTHNNINQEQKPLNSALKKLDDFQILHISPRALSNQPVQVNPKLVKSIPLDTKRAAASTIVAYARGYLTRRLMQTERVQTTVQTIRDALLCALQLHTDREIRGADVDLHRRLIQQITAACYTLHETFVCSRPQERCAIIAADRARRRSLAERQLSPSPHKRHKDVMSQSHSGAFPSCKRRPRPVSPMTQSNYETFSSASAGMFSSTRRPPWR